MSSKPSKSKEIRRVPIGTPLSDEMKKRGQRFKREAQAREFMGEIFWAAAWLQPIAEKEAAAGVQDAAAALAWLDRMSGASLLRIIQGHADLSERFQRATGHALPAVDTAPQLGWSKSDEG